MQKQVFVVDLCIRARRERDVLRQQTVAYGGNKKYTATKLMGYLPQSYQLLFQSFILVFALIV